MGFCRSIPVCRDNDDESYCIRRRADVPPYAAVSINGWMLTIAYESLDVRTVRDEVSPQSPEGSVRVVVWCGNSTVVRRYDDVRYGTLAYDAVRCLGFVSGLRLGPERFQHNGAPKV